MRAVRKATRESAGRELSEAQVQQKYDEVVAGTARMRRSETLELIKRFFTADELEVASKTVSLICPISKRRIVDAVRGSRCRHIECFDLRTYLEYHRVLAFWECPFAFCREQVNCDQLRIDE